MINQWYKTIIDYHGEEEPEQPSQTKIQTLDDSYR